MFRRNCKRYDLLNGRLSDNAALIASINGPSFGGFASISTLTASLRSAMLPAERLIGMTHDDFGRVRRLSRPARGNVVWFGSRLGNVAISAPDLNQEWSCRLPHLRVSIFVFLLRAFVPRPARQSRSIEQTHLEAASIILSPNKSFPPHQR